MEADRVEPVWSIALWQYGTKMSEEESRAEKCEAFLHNVAAKNAFFSKNVSTFIRIKPILAAKSRANIKFLHFSCTKFGNTKKKH